MNCYQFITDPQAVVAYGDRVLKPLEDNEVYMVFLAARNKYLTDAQKKTVKLAGQDMIARAVIKNKQGVKQTTGEMLLRALEKLQVPFGYYKDAAGNYIPASAFTVFVTVNPRDCAAAALALAHDLMDGLATNRNDFQHLENKVLSFIHKEVSRKIYLDLDVDLKVPMDDSERNKVISSVLSPLGNTPIIQVNTRGGYHLLVEYSEIDPTRKNSFHQDLVKLQAGINDGHGLFELELKRDGVSGATMTPIPGTTQGGYCPSFHCWDGV